MVENNGVAERTEKAVNRMDFNGWSKWVDLLELDCRRGEIEVSQNLFSLLFLDSEITKLPMVVMNGYDEVTRAQRLHHSFESATVKLGVFCLYFRARIRSRSNGVCQDP
ncbi:unnamed protein product, partial [Ilex paraguariensis]